MTLSLRSPLSSLLRVIHMKSKKYQLPIGYSIQQILAPKPILLTLAPLCGLRRDRCALSPIFLYPSTRNLTFAAHKPDGLTIMVTSDIGITHGKWKLKPTRYRQQSVQFSIVSITPNPDPIARVTNGHVRWSIARYYRPLRPRVRYCPSALALWDIRVIP